MGNWKEVKKCWKTEKTQHIRKNTLGFIILAGEEGFEPSAYGFGEGVISSNRIHPFFYLIPTVLARIISLFDLISQGVYLMKP